MSAQSYKLLELLSLKRHVFRFHEAAVILGRHPVTLHRQAKSGLLKTVDTPVGRRITAEEIERQAGAAPTGVERIALFGAG